MSVAKICDSCGKQAVEDAWGWYELSADVSHRAVGSIAQVEWHFCSLACASECIQGMDGDSDVAVPA